MAEIKQAKFIDQTGQEKDAVFIGAEKAIYDDSGKRLDQKLEEREKATGLRASDTQGILGSIGAEVSLQTIIDKVAEKVMKELMTKTMMSGEQVDDESKVPTSALAYAMQQAITKNQNDITQLNSEHIPYVGNISEYGTMEALFADAQNGRLKIGVCQWNTSLRPDDTNGVVFIGNWEVMAICLSGKIYRIYNNQWVLSTV